MLSTDSPLRCQRFLALSWIPELCGTTSTERHLQTRSKWVSAAQGWDSKVTDRHPGSHDERQGWCVAGYHSSADSAPPANQQVVGGAGGWQQVDVLRSYSQLGVSASRVPLVSQLAWLVSPSKGPVADRVRQDSNLGSDRLSRNQIGCESVRGDIIRAALMAARDQAFVQVDGPDHDGESVSSSPSRWTVVAPSRQGCPACSALCSLLILFCEVDCSYTRPLLDSDSRTLANTV